MPIADLAIDKVYVDVAGQGRESGAGAPMCGPTRLRDVVVVLIGYSIFNCAVECRKDEFRDCTRAAQIPVMLDPGTESVGSEPEEDIAPRSE